LPLFRSTEVLFTSLLFVISADLREVLVSLTALELPATLEDVFISTPLETSVALPAELFSTISAGSNCG
jgi:hypothetical protein